MSAHQCPLCELRFLWRTELDAHLADEHANHIRVGFPSTRKALGHLQRTVHPRHLTRPREQ